MNDLAHALLEAHVAFEVSRLKGEPLERLIDEHISATFVWLSSAKLNDIATRERIIGLIDRVVINLRVSGGITELAGEMARAVVSSESSADTFVSEVLDRTSYEEFTEKLLGLESVRSEVIGMATQSPAFSSVASRILSHGVIDFVFRKQSTRTGPLAGKLSDLSSSLLSGILPKLEQRVEERLSRYIEKHRPRIASEGKRHLTEVLDQDSLRSIADEVWDVLSKLSLADAFAFVGARDVEDFVVICYEFWLRFRKTRYFQSILSELVGYFFDKYGDESVFSLIDDMGVSEQMVKEELWVFLAPLLEQAHADGFLEERIRAHFAPFYQSQHVAQLLSREPA